MEISFSFTVIIQMLVGRKKQTIVFCCRSFPILQYDMKHYSLPTSLQHYSLSQLYANELPLQCTRKAQFAKRNSEEKRMQNNNNNNNNIKQAHKLSKRNARIRFVYYTLRK